MDLGLGRRQEARAEAQWDGAPGGGAGGKGREGMAPQGKGGEGRGGVNWKSSLR